MNRTLAVIVAVCLAGLLGLPAAAQEDDVEERIDDLEDRLEKVERDSALDRDDFGGDFRFEAHSIQASVPDHFDGLALQRDLVDTVFYLGRPACLRFRGRPTKRLGR